MSDKDIEELKRLEEALWRSETRFDLTFQEKVFAPDFFEFGRSGRVYSRKQAIRTDALPIKAQLPLLNLKIKQIGSSAALVTYQSVVQYDTLERANRSSLWLRTPTGWQLQFHQGTPTQ